jgi:Reverse transcriptase (RNA-dependent DNA polymerase).
MDETRNKGGFITHETILQMRIQGHEQNTRFLVADLGNDDAVLGIGWIKEHKPVIDWKTEGITFPYCEDHCKKKPENQEPQKTRGSDTSGIESTEEEEIEEDGLDPLDFEEVREKIKASSTLSSRIAEEHQIKEGEKTFEELVPEEFRDFQDVFSKEKAERIPTRRPYDHAINLKEGTEPARDRIYPISPKERGALKEFLEENLRKGYIRKSNSEYAAPFFFVKKKDGGLRPVQDYRKLNKITIKDKFPLPLSQQLLDHLSGASVFSTLDLRWGYENVRIKEGDERKLAFVTEFGLYEPTSDVLWNVQCTCHISKNDE